MRGILGLLSAVRVSMGFYSEVLSFSLPMERDLSGSSIQKRECQWGFTERFFSFFFTDGKGSVRNPRFEDPEERREIRLLVRRVACRKKMHARESRAGGGGGRQREGAVPSRQP